MPVYDVGPAAVPDTSGSSAIVLAGPSTTPLCPIPSLLLHREAFRDLRSLDGF